MTFSRVRRDEHDELSITIPEDLLRKAGLKEGDHVQIHADERSGELKITLMQIKPRARYDYREIAREVIAEELSLLDRLAA